MLAEHKQKAEADDEEQKTGFEVRTTMKEVIPVPDVLRERHGNQFNGGQQQEKSANDLSGVGQPYRCTAAGPVGEGSMIQKLPAFLVNTTPCSGLAGSCCGECEYSAMMR